jgi:hypothetical protein
MNTGTLFEPSNLSVVPTLLIEILGAFFDTPKFQGFWGIVRNIPLPFSSFARSQAVEGKTTERRERSRGTPQEWVRKTAHFGGICIHIAFGTGREWSLASEAQT